MANKLIYSLLGLFQIYWKKWTLILFFFKKMPSKAFFSEFSNNISETYNLLSINDGSQNRNEINNYWQLIHNTVLICFFLLT